MLAGARIAVLAASLAVGAGACSVGDAGGHKAAPPPAASSRVAERAPAPSHRLIPAGEILFTVEDGAEASVWAARADGSHLRQLSPSDGASYYPVPVRSSAGRVLALATEGGESQAHREYLVELSGRRTAVPRSFDSMHLRAPSLSPDGAFAVVESDRDSFRDIFRIDLQSGAASRLTREKNGAFEPALSPDGSRIAFVSTRDGNPEIYTMDADGEHPARLTAFYREDMTPRWSPDGSQIMFVSAREDADRLFVMAADGSGQRRLTTTTGDADEGEAVWSPDGSRVAYVVRGNGISEVWVVNVAGGAARRISDAGDEDDHPSWSPDGHWLAFEHRAGRATVIVVAPLAGGPTRTLSGPSGQLMLPRWRP